MKRNAIEPSSRTQSSLVVHGRLLVISMAALAMQVFAPQARAVDPNVAYDDNTADGNISLREAIAASSPGDIIQLAAVDYQVSGTFGQININKSLTIVGFNQYATLITRIGPNSRIFVVEGTGSNNNTVEILDVTIRRGRLSGGADGAAIAVGDGTVLNDSLPTLRMKRCTLTENETASAGGAVCLAVDTVEAVFIDCTFSSNRATGTSNSNDDGGGAIRVRNVNSSFEKCTFSNNFTARDGGAIYISGPAGIAQLLNCTLSGNRANRNGGAMRIDAISFGFLTDCTVTLNTCDDDNNDTGNGGGLSCNSIALNSVFLRSTIVAGNTDKSSTGGNPTVAPDVASSTVVGDPCLSSAGNNLIGKNDGAQGDFPAGSPNGNNDLAGTIASPIDPMLGLLEFNGGVTQTHALLMGSPAIDPNTNLLRGGVPPTCEDLEGIPVALDQRNVQRPQGPKCDIGAFEFGDCDENGLDDMFEIIHPPDFRGNSPLDLNGNGVLDVCEGLCCTDGQTAIVLALDVSNSISAAELTDEIDGIQECLIDPTIIPRNGKVQIGVVIYGATAHDLLGGMVTINSISDIDAISTALDDLLTDRIVATNATNLGGALQLAQTLLAGSTENDHILLTGDGNSNTGPNVKTECFSVGAAGIQLCSIAVGANILGQTELEECAKATGGKFGIAMGMVGFPEICAQCLGGATMPCILSEERCAAINGVYKGDDTTNDAPILMCPPIMVECGYSMIPTPATMDECPDLLMFTYSDYAMPVTPCDDHVVQLIMRAWIATDQCGDTGTCVQQIAVVDTTPPFFTYCPPNVTVPFGAPTDPSATGQAVAMDACSPTVMLTYSDIVTDLDCTVGYKITRTWTATDECGNSSSDCMQMILVEGASRAQYHLKADLFVWPFVRIRWDNKNTPSPADDTVLEDTFLSVINDDSVAHTLKFMFVDGRTWRFANRTLYLTANQPRYFSAYSGTGGNTQLASFRDLNPLGLDSFPATAQENERYMEGFILAWTVDHNNRPYGSNQIAASSTVVCFDRESAWDYKPWGYRSLFTGVKPDPTILRLNGLAGQYQASPCCLLIDFYAAGTSGLCPHPNSTCTQDFEVSLLNMIMDFRALPDHDLDGTPGELPLAGGDSADSEPPTTAVSVLTWNEAEVEVSNTQRCVTCWDSRLASLYGFMGGASPFAQNTLQTNKGKGRLCGSAAAACNRPASSPFSQILIYSKLSRDLPIVGVAHKTLTWSGGGSEKASSLLTPIGDRTDGFIIFDATDQGPPPTIHQPGSGSVDPDGPAVGGPRRLRSR